MVINKKGSWKHYLEIRGRKIPVPYEWYDKYGNDMERRYVPYARGSQFWDYKIVTSGRNPHDAKEALLNIYPFSPADMDKMKIHTIWASESEIERARKKAVRKIQSDRKKRGLEPAKAYHEIMGEADRLVIGKLRSDRVRKRTRTHRR